MKRGALIIFEGCDRSGKSTQCRLLGEALQKNGKKVEMMRFPDRSTTIGKMISNYLEQKCELHDKAIHLLFSANRWELQPKMMKLLQSGVSIVVDRYSYSGVAFTAAKKGIDIKWCKQPEIGLPKPDVVLYLDVPSSVAATRGQFGEERYEKESFQEKAASVFHELKENNWKVLDASQSIEELHKEILSLATIVIENRRDTEECPVGKLWVEQNGDKPGKGTQGNIDKTTTGPP